MLRDQVARLQRSSHRLIWLNPLIGTADYAPLTRGLQAALPYVDDFLPARTLNDLGGPGGTLEPIAGAAYRTRQNRSRFSVLASRFVFRFGSACEVRGSAFGVRR